MILSFYCVRNNKGQFYKSDGYWVEELKKAKTYKNSGPARSIITKEFKKKNICELIQLPVLHMVVVDEGDRVQKVIEQQKKAELNRQLYYAEQKLKNVMKSVPSQSQIDLLKERIENLRKQIDG